MRRILLSIFLTALLVLALASAVSAVGEKLTVAVGTPTIDGTIDDVWSTAERVQLGYCKGGDLMESVTTLPDTCSVYASVLYDNNAIYFLFEIEDDEFAFEDDAGSWANDSLYLYLDEGKTDEATWNDSQCQLALIPSEGLELIPRRGQAPADYDLAFSYPTNNTCVIEFKYVPRTLALQEGTEFSVDFQYNDANSNADRDYCLGWSDDNDDAANTSSVWGLATLGAAASVDEKLDQKAEAPNTFDFGVVAAVAAVISLGGFAVSKKRK